MEKTEFEKISEYYSKIGEYRRNFYKNFLKKGHLCDYFRNGEWKVGYILDKNDYYLTIIDLNRYHLEKDETKFQIEYSERLTYFRKFTHPSPNREIKERFNKSELAKKINLLQDKDNINIFKENINDKNNAYNVYYFLRGILYRIFDQAICKSKDKNSGVEEGFKIILLILEYLSEFYKYIHKNFDDFINYKNEISISELADLVLIEKKYAIFSFWEEANLLMNKIFYNNEEYFDWFIDSDKTLQKIIPSSPNFKKISSAKNILYALYEHQIKSLKNNDYNYKTSFGQSLILNNICNNTNLINNNNQKPIYIINYFIDYFFALGGYKSLFSMCNNFFNVYVSLSVLENICLAEEYTNNFGVMFDGEKNKIQSNLFKFMEEMNESNFNKYSKHLIINLLKKGCNLSPNVQKKSNNLIFEELYLKYLLKLFLLNKNENKKVEILNDLNNILTSIEYNNLFDEKNINDKNNTKNLDELINDEKYNKRDKYIKEMNYFNFCSIIKNSKMIELIFTKSSLADETLEIFLPILIIMYKNNFGFDSLDKSVNEINTIKNLIFNKLLSRIKFGLKAGMEKIQKIFCDFCEI